jgi:putative ABC transport system permease protein
MFKNYFKIALRQLLKNKTFSLINIMGLSIGMAAFILLMLWVNHEVSYEQFHSKKDRIYSLWNKTKWGDKWQCWDVTPKIAAKSLRENFPEIEKVTRVGWMENRMLKGAGKTIFPEVNRVVDPEFLAMFDFPLVKGDITTALKDPHSIVLTEELSKKLFGDRDPLGENIKLENGDNLIVTGVITSPGNNTQFRFEYLLPWKYMESVVGEETDWGNNAIQTYVLLKEHASISALQPKIKNLRKSQTSGENVFDMFLYPLKRSHLHANFENGVETGGRIETVRLFGMIAGFILLIACINFMNLSTARSEKRAKEVGIRKTVGAQRSSIIKQFLCESLMLSFAGFVIALAMVQLALPVYNQLLLEKLAIDYTNVTFWLLSLAFIFITGLLAGSYPAFYLSAFKPIVILKGTFKSVNAAINPRKALVVLQFVFAIVLVIATMIVKQQISYVSQRDVGYDRSQLIYHRLNDKLKQNYELLKNDLLSQNIAASVTKTSAPLTEEWSNSWGFEWEGKKADDKTVFNRYCADDALVTTAGFKLLSGRDFDLNVFPQDSNAIILNASAVKAMGLKDPIGKIIKDSGNDYHVIGVIGDFILSSPYQPIRPMIITGARPLFFNFIHIRLKNAMTDLKKAEALFKKYNPEFPVEYKFIDQEYATKFEEMERVAVLSTLFAGLTIFISCLGLFGLVSYMAENRIREIGIRKVLGATMVNIVAMLSAGFVKLVLIAFVIATPIAWYLMHQWLQNYPYHVTIQWWIFLLAGIVSLFISLTTVIYQSLKAAMSNPVKSLRTE